MQATPQEDIMTDERGNRPTLVLGGTGKTGRRVVERLAARGIPVRVGSRAGEPPFDWEDRSTWAPALDGVGVRLPHLLPRPRRPGAVEAIGSFAELAVISGVPQAGAAVRARRARGRTRRAGGARLRRRPDHPALDLVHAELQRGLHARARAERRDPAPGRRRPDPVPRRRRHRRRRCRGAHRRPAHRPSSTS